MPPSPALAPNSLPKVLEALVFCFWVIARLCVGKCVEGGKPSHSSRVPEWGSTISKQREANVHEYLRYQTQEHKHHAPCTNK